MIVLTSLLSDIEEEGMRLSFYFSNVNPLAGALFFVKVASPELVRESAGRGGLAEEGRAEAERFGSFAG